MITLTLSQIINLSKGNPRRMKHLADGGAIVAIEENRQEKAARRYTVSEAAISCILARLDQMNIPARTLHEIGAGLREIYRVPTDFSFKSVDEAYAMWAREVFLTTVDKKKSQNDKGEIALFIGLQEIPNGSPSGFSIDESNRIRNYVTLERGRAGIACSMSVFSDENGWQFSVDHGPIGKDQIDMFLVLNLHRILSPLRT